MIEVTFRATNPIEEISAWNLHQLLLENGFDLTESPAGYWVHVHNLDCDSDVVSMGTGVVGE